MDSETGIIRIGERSIGAGRPTYIVAEISANHNQKLETAVQILKAAREAGADAVKLQTYTPETLTLRSDKEYFRIGSGTLWDGRTLYDLYQEAYTPWDWHPKLQEIATELGLDLFSTPFDSTAVDFLEGLGMPAYKVASFEIVDLPLIEYIASKGRPIIMSTGMATLGEIEEAVMAARNAGACQIALLRCISAYPAPPDEMHLRTIPHMSEAFGVPVGLSDHTLGIAVAAAAVALGASIVEKHFTLSRTLPGPDSAFSIEPHEFKAMVSAIRTVEKALGSIRYGASEHERKSLVFRRSLFVVRDMRAGEIFTEENVRSIRPGYGLAPRYYRQVIGCKAARDIKGGTPLSWDVIRLSKNPTAS